MDFCRSKDIPVIVKGLRAVSDFEYELQMAQMNRSSPAWRPSSCRPPPRYFSSSLIKQIATFGGESRGWCRRLSTTGRSSDRQGRDSTRTASG